MKEPKSIVLNEEFLPFCNITSQCTCCCDVIDSGDSGSICATTPLDTHIHTVKQIYARMIIHRKWAMNKLQITCRYMVLIPKKTAEETLDTSCVTFYA